MNRNTKRNESLKRYCAILPIVIGCIGIGNLFMKITQASAYAVLDSRGVPTIAVSLMSDGHFAIGMSPSGASTGSHEAYEWRDGGESFGGKNIQKAIECFETIIAPQLIGKSWQSVASFDQWLIDFDGTSNFQKIGGNLAIATSISFLRLQAAIADQEVFEVLLAEFHYSDASAVVAPMVNVINGGKHAASGLAIQETMIVPMVGATTSEKIMIAAEIFGALKKVLTKHSMPTLVGDEGGFAPAIQSVSEAFDLIKEACDLTPYRFGEDIKLALDVAATELFHNDNYQLEGQTFSAAALVDFYQALTEKYPIISIEDPFAEDDFDAWQQLQDRIGHKVQIVGDDLTVTNVERMKLVQNKKLLSAMIVKPNQIGTISQTMAAIALAKQYGWKTIISHRSGETEDTTIADIAYAVSSPFIKTGSCSRSERLAKYNRLIQLDQRASRTRGKRF